MRLLILAYPVLVHTAVVIESAPMMALAIVIIAAAMLTPPLRTGRIWAWLVLAASAAAASWLAWREATIYLLFVPPVLLNLFLMHLFLSSLRSGRTPLISAVARAIRGNLPDSLAHYTRRLTQIWAAIFGFMAAWSAIAAVAADHTTWSLITNVLNYVIVVLFLLIEYPWRRWRFRHEPHPSLRDYVQGVSRVDFRQL